MNAVEHIVESYYRYIQNCYTVSDIKVIKGAGRQLDVLAVNPKLKKFFHIECSVTHIERWNLDSFRMAKLAEYKFCGFKRPDPSVPFEDEMTEVGEHREAIESMYRAYGVDDLSKLERVWCAWIVQDPQNLENYQERFRRKHGFSFTFLSFRDEVLPAVEDFVGTSNYDDEILRTLSLVRQKDRQQENVVGTLEPQ